MRKTSLGLYDYKEAGNQKLYFLNLQSNKIIKMVKSLICITLQPN